MSGPSCTPLTMIEGTDGDVSALNCLHLITQIWWAILDLNQ